MDYSNLFTNILDLLVGLEVDERNTIELDPDDYTVEDGSPQELSDGDADR